MKIKTSKMKSAKKKVPAKDHKGAKAAAHSYGIKNPDHNTSGSQNISTKVFTPDSIIPGSDVLITGKRYRGYLKNFYNSSVQESPVKYDTSGAASPVTSSGDKAFIVEFTEIRGLIKLELHNNTGNIAMVVPWSGLDFNTAPVFPQPSSPTMPPRAAETPKKTVAMMGVETKKLLIQIDPISSGFNIQSLKDNLIVTSSVYPSNIRISVSDRPPFWSYPGVLTGSAKITGLATEMNTLLAEANAAMALQIKVQSDTAGVIEGLEALTSSTEASLNQVQANWGGQAGTHISLQALEEKEFEFIFPSKTSTGTWSFNELLAGVTGTFPPWRAYDQQPQLPPQMQGDIFMKVNAKFGVTRRFNLKEKTELYGCAIPMGPLHKTSEILLEIYPDEKEVPMDTDPLASSLLSLDSQTVHTWAEFLLDKPLILNEGYYWVILKAKTGNINWRGSVKSKDDPTLTTKTLFFEEGTQWQSYPQIKSLGGSHEPFADIRILRKAYSKETQPLVQFSWSSKGSVATEGLRETSKEMDLKLALPASSADDIPLLNFQAVVPVKIKSLATGTLNISQAQGRYTIQAVT